MATPLSVGLVYFFFIQDFILRRGKLEWIIGQRYKFVPKEFYILIGLLCSKWIRKKNIVF